MSSIITGNCGALQNLLRLHKHKLRPLGWKRTCRGHKTLTIASVTSGIITFAACNKKRLRSLRTSPAGVTELNFSDSFASFGAFLMGLSNKSHVCWLISRVLSVCYSALISRYPRLPVSHTWMQPASSALPPKTGRLLPSSDVGHCKKRFSGDSFILQKRVCYHICITNWSHQILQSTRIQLPPAYITDYTSTRATQ